jgi:preprotein translocase subunit SecF
VPFEIVRPGTQIDFIGKRRLAGVLSLALLGLGCVAIAVNGVKLGIDFTGGTEMQVLFESGVEAAEGPIRLVVGACGVADASVVRYGDTDANEFLIRFQVGAQAAGGGEECRLNPEQVAALERAKLAGGGGGDAGEKGETIDKLAYALGNSIGPLQVQRVEFVGPRVGGELRSAGIRSLLVACLLILIYIAFRFSARFAPGAIIALVHDVGITAGIFVIVGMEFDLRVLAALLAILGYSLNDTIIIYDRIRENMALRTKFDLADVLNQSVNQTLARTVLTSGTTMVAVLSLWVLGGEVIRPFAIAMAIGIVVGTYSSVFIAPPTLLFLENRFGGREGRGTTTGGATTGGAETGYAVRHDAPSRASGQGSRKQKKSRPKKQKKRR